MTVDWFSIGLFALLALLIVFMFRNSRKRRRDQEEMHAKLQPGAEVMTQHGIYGTLVSVDDEKNEAVIETTPGTRLRVHRQTLARVIDPVEAEQDVIAEGTDADGEPRVESLEETQARLDEEPQYGERLDEEKPKRTPRKKASE